MEVARHQVRTQMELPLNQMEMGKKATAHSEFTCIVCIALALITAMETTSDQH